jgi:hypothetical protein
MTLAKRQLYKNEKDKNVKLLGALFLSLQIFSKKFILYSRLCPKPNASPKTRLQHYKL